MEGVSPHGWSFMTIPEIISKDGIFIDGDWVESKDQDPDGEVRLIQLADIAVNNFKNKSDRFLTSEKAAQLRCTFLKENDILVARMPDPLGRACLFPFSTGKFVTVVDVAIIRPGSNGCNHRWLMYIINSPEISREIFNSASGSTRLRISRRNLGGIRFPLPPLAEQQRIVDKLDALFGHLEALRTRLDRIPELLKSFRQQVLTQAVTGKLTEEWRKEMEEKGVKLRDWVDYYEPILEDRVSQFQKGNFAKKPEWLNYSLNDTQPYHITSWQVCPVGFLCDSIVPGRDKPKSFTGNIPWITTPDLTKDRIEAADAKLYLSNYEVEEVGAKIIPKNSVIISIVGRFGISSIAGCECVINQQLHAFLPSGLIIPEYLMFYFKTLEGFMNEISSSTTVAYINKAKANSIPINVPLLDEQVEIVSRVQALFAVSDKIEAQYQSLKAKIDALPQAILTKAFRGELVPQDPNDEPASALLERVRGERLKKSGKQLTEEGS